MIRASGVEPEVIDYQKTPPSRDRVRQLAAEAGRPRAARAAGTLCSEVQVPLFLPVHRVTRADGSTETFLTRCRIDTVNELEYFLNGGILQYVLRNLAA